MTRMSVLHVSTASSLNPICRSFFIDKTLPCTSQLLLPLLLFWGYWLVYRQVMTPNPLVRVLASYDSILCHRDLSKLKKTDPF